MRKISMNSISRVLEKISEGYDLYVPISNNGKTDFGLWENGTEADFNTLKTVKSPKDVFFPQSENLYRCITKDKKLKILPEQLLKKPFVLFGARACDVRGFEVLDRVFLSEPVDTFYEARRNLGVVVSVACFAPCQTCFCTVFGVDAADADADVCAYIADGDMYFSPKTEKGEKLMELINALLDDGDADKVEAEKRNIKSILDKLPYKGLDLSGWENEEKHFSSPLWETFSTPCLACGTCTFVCPTCQCYDIKDANAGNEVIRYRCWDSCMYSDFTMMAHGNNRTSRHQRFRQRFMHKLTYFPKNNDGMYSCVGCGRCVALCPSGLNIVKVIKAFNDREV